MAFVPKLRQAPAGIRVDEDNAAPTLRAIARVRADVWAHQLGAPSDPAAWTDDHDEHARHFVVREGSDVLGAVRLCCHERLDEVPYPHTYIPAADQLRAMQSGVERYSVWSRLVVLPAVRGRGYAALLDELCLGAACEYGGVCLAHVEHETNRERILAALGFLTLATSFSLTPWGPAGPTIRYKSCAVSADVLRARLPAVLAGT